MLKSCPVGHWDEKCSLKQILWKYTWYGRENFVGGDNENVHWINNSESYFHSVIQLSLTHMSPPGIPLACNIQSTKTHRITAKIYHKSI